MPLGKAFVQWHTAAVEAQDIPARERIEADLDKAVAEITEPAGGEPPDE